MNLTENQSSPFQFTISGLTSSSATSTAPAGDITSSVFSMQTTVAPNAKDDDQNGINGADQSFSFNADGAVADFEVTSANRNAVQISSVGGNGTDGSDSTGGGDRMGGTGHTGGAGGALSVVIQSADLTGSETALLVESAGNIAGKGGTGNSSDKNGTGGTGGVGGKGGSIDVALHGISASNTVAGTAVEVTNLGGDGGEGGEGRSGGFDETATGGLGGLAGLANDIGLTITEGLSVSSLGTGVLIKSTGGSGSEGGLGNSTEKGGTAASGRGGFGANGGAITLQSTDGSEQIEIDATAGPAVRLISTGGDGGPGGRAIVTSGSTAFAGEGGNGAEGGAVTFNIASNDVILKTTGANNAGLIVESLGGDGGNSGTISGNPNTGFPGAGGDAGNVNVLLGTGNTSITSTSGIGLIAISRGGAVVNTLSEDLDVGNRAGDGKTVTVRTSGTASISAENGIRLLSEGGSAVATGLSIFGSRGGDGGQLRLDYNPNEATTGAWSVEGVDGSASKQGYLLESVGGSSDTGGHGGAVYAGASGSTYKVTSSVDGFSGAVFSSTGGNGGVSAGDGGSVIVDGSWDVQLTGSDGIGMLLESLGGTNGDQKGPGGSGKAVSIEETFVGQVSTNATGVSVVSNGTNGTVGGDAGDVTIRGVWAISSTDTGLNVESVGGDSATEGKGGVGGLVTVDVENIFDLSSPMIQTTASEAHGINIVQSSGENAPNSVFSTLLVESTIDGDIDVSGAGAHGLQAASSGNTRGGIDISVLSGVTINGGAASTSGPDGSAISVIDGSDNSLTNAGLLTSSSGVAVQYSGTGSLNIKNVDGGTIHGSVPNQDGSGTITVQNAMGGVIEAGARFDAELIENSGKFSPGGDGVVKASNSLGDFIHNAEGVLLFDILTQDAHDQVFIGRTLSLAQNSTIELAFLDLTNRSSLFGSYDILIADDILFASDGLFAEASAFSTGGEISPGDFLNVIGPKGFRFDVSAEDYLGGGEVLRLTVSAIPLPAGAWLLLTGLGGFVLLGRRSNAVICSSTQANQL